MNFTVTRVGTELENQLKQYNYNVIHDTSYHDYPAYNGSYTRSLATVENILKETRKVEVLHNLIKNNGQNFDISNLEKELAEKLSI